MYYNALLAEDVQEKLDFASKLIERDVNEALKVFNVVLKQRADCMKKRMYINNCKRNGDRFDKECKLARPNVRKCLRKFRKTLKNGDNIAYCKARIEYKNLLYKKKKIFNDAILNKLIESVNDQNMFWDTMHRVQSKKTQPSNNITSDDWFNHFKSVHEKDIDTEEDDIFQESFFN